MSRSRLTRRGHSDGIRDHPASCAGRRTLDRNVESPDDGDARQPIGRGRPVSIITDRRGRRAVSNLGWVDHGAVWSFGSADDEPRTIPLSDAKHLDLLAGTGPYFAA